jgi:hypothetical protein
MKVASPVGDAEAMCGHAGVGATHERQMTSEVVEQLTTKWCKSYLMSRSEHRASI